MIVPVYSGSGFTNLQGSTGWRRSALQLICLYQYPERAAYVVILSYHEQEAASRNALEKEDFAGNYQFYFG
jgi:hypothetical protein